MSRLRVDALRFHRRGPIDLEIGPGACVALTGSSGSGKTLMLRALVDLDPNEGEVWLDGIARSDLAAPEWRRRVGMLPAESLWWHATVGAHLTEPEPRWLEMLGFGSDVLAWSVERLSSGERQRLALVRLLSRRPEALLLDEPTANLDGSNVARVEGLLGEYRLENDAPMLWVTHDDAQARRIASCRFVLEAGQLVQRWDACR